MRHFCPVLVVLAMLVLSESASVDCSRTLQSTNKIGSDESREAVPGVKDVRISSTSDSAQDRSGRVLAEQQVRTMAAGPSRKGPGH
ncbi:hypothetical protein QQP08_000151 [Theobroma cacao]|uniref:Secreted protein n=1 Tax=Theobroma cacao TaxID=3641 RepID=A0A061DI75_THECC|nr:Uncharacterized protein TCM_000703 [Theobroma cacao]WRX07664.1 hypothetical protein QQP08_000151 [Theobroma cacao]